MKDGPKKGIKFTQSMRPDFESFNWVIVHLFFFKENISSSMTWLSLPVLNFCLFIIAWTKSLQQNNIKENIYNWITNNIKKFIEKSFNLFYFILNTENYLHFMMSKEDKLNSVDHIICYVLWASLALFGDFGPHFSDFWFHLAVPQ